MELNPQSNNIIDSSRHGEVGLLIKRQNKTKQTENVVKQKDHKK